MVDQHNHYYESKCAAPAVLLLVIHRTSLKYPDPINNQPLLG